MKTHIRYYFENFIARKSNFVYFLMIVSAVFALLMIAVEMSLGLIENDSFFNIWWNRLERLLEIEESGVEFKERLVTLIYWIFSVTFSGTIIAFLAAKVSSFIEDLKKGHSHVIDTNHYIIVGWNSTIFKIFDEIEVANQNQSKPTILCFNGLDNLEMNNIINTERPNQKNIRIITRSGDIYSIQDLARTNMNNSKSVIILDDTIQQSFNIETTILAVKQNLNNQNVPIIAQFNNGENIDIISKLKGNVVYSVLKDNIISSVTAQSIRNKHISSVVLDFIDYDGDELYFFPSDGLAQKTFKQAMLMLQEVTLVGIRTADGQVLLNPKKDYIILKDDHLIVIAEDDNLEIKLKSENLKRNYILTGFLFLGLIFAEHSALTIMTLLCTVLYLFAYDDKLRFKKEKIAKILGIAIFATSLALIFINGLYDGIVDKVRAVVYSEDLALSTRDLYNEFRWDAINDQKTFGYGFIHQSSSLMNQFKLSGTSAFMERFTVIDSGYVDLLIKFGYLGTAVMLVTLNIYYLFGFFKKYKNQITLAMSLYLIQYAPVNYTWSVYTFSHGIIPGAIALYVIIMYQDLKFDNDKIELA